MPSIVASAGSPSAAPFLAASRKKAHEAPLSASGRHALYPLDTSRAVIAITRERVGSIDKEIGKRSRDNNCVMAHALGIVGGEAHRPECHHRQID